MEIARYEVWLVALDPVKGKEINKTRPCLIISPNEVNQNLYTPIIAPMTTVIHNYPSRVICKFQNVRGEVALDQMRASDVSRFRRRIGMMDEATCRLVAETLVAMFEY